MAERKRLSEETRREEILNACDQLYAERGFREITIKDISTKTSFSRPSIYNYFQTKEEIFLALLTREYALWTADLQKIAETGESLPKQALAEEIAASLEKRRTMLKLMAMNLYETEENSRPEFLVTFKRQFAVSLDAFASLLRRADPPLTAEQADAVRYAFFPFMNGVYAYAYPTEKQCKAMDKAGLAFRRMTITEITGNFLKQIL